MSTTGGLSIDEPL